MEITTLELLSSKLRDLKTRLERSALPSQHVLDDNDPLARAANECEFKLPEPLTIEALTETLARKMDTVELLLQRAREHENLPEDAQLAAEQEYLASENDYSTQKQSPGLSA
jgi:hypothetical protein